MGEWEPDLEVETNDNSLSWTTALMWIILAKVEGSWKLGQGELKLTQNFQMINGTLTNGAKTSTIREGRIRGNEITFDIDGKKYTGQIKDNRMSGTFTGGSSKNDWVATK
jgi:hypothetical protein